MKTLKLLTLTILLFFAQSQVMAVHFPGQSNLKQQEESPTKIVKEKEPSYKDLQLSFLKPPNRRGGQCDAFGGCTWPARCENGWCVKSGGQGGQCDAFGGCTWPARCENGWCVKSNGQGGECDAFGGCEFPARCENGWCVR